MTIASKSRTLVLLLVLAAIAPVAISQTTPVILWNRETADHPLNDDVGYFSSTAVDSAGTVHIAYDDFQHHSLRYAKKTASGAWVTEWIDLVGYPAYAGDLVSLALDAYGRPHVTYQYTANIDNDGVDLRHAWRFCFDPVHDLGCMWAKETIEAGVFRTGGGGSTSLAFDAMGRANVVYFDNWRSQLKWARREGSSWGIVDVAPAVSGRAAMALDSNGFPRIIFTDEYYSVPPVKYARVACTAIVFCGFNIETIGVGQIGNLAIDTVGRVHVAYRDLIDIKYALKACTTCAWTVQTVGSTLSDWFNVRPWIALKSDGSPRIIFGDFNGVLNYARIVSGAWTVSGIDSQVVPYADASITISPDNRAHVTYQSSATLRRAVKHATELFWTDTPRQ